MTTITGLFDVSRRRLEDDTERTTTPPSGQRTTRGTEAIPQYRDATLDAFYARLVATQASTSIAPAEATTARDKAVQQRMDAVRDAYSGPYTVEGQPISARPMFRMHTGASEANAKLHRKELETITSRAGCRDALDAAAGGYASPRDLVRVTQALIGAGKLPNGGAPSLEDRIRAMQWEWGVGVDCARYSREALTSAACVSDGKLQMYTAGTEGFRDMDHPLPATKDNPVPKDKRLAWNRISVNDCRPGDLLTLDPKPPETAGHNVVVYSNEVLRPDQQAGLAKKDPKAAELFRSPGPFHRIKVDSSWGAGPDGASYGGFRRETWLLDESTKQWGFVDRETNTFVVSKDGPSVWDRFHGAYRPKAGA